MLPLKLSAYRLAKDINVPVSRIQEILNNRRKLSMDTALRLSHHFAANIPVSGCTAGDVKSMGNFHVYGYFDSTALYNVIILRMPFLLRITS